MTAYSDPKGLLRDTGTPVLLCWLHLSASHSPKTGHTQLPAAECLETSRLFTILYFSQLKKKFIIRWQRTECSSNMFVSHSQYMSHAQADTTACSKICPSTCQCLLSIYFHIYGTSLLTLRYIRKKQVVKSQNHRMVEIGGHLWQSTPCLSRTPSPGYFCPWPVAQGYVQMTFE